MKEMLKKVSEKMKIVFGYGIMISLFAGGLIFLGYVAALIIGGDTAALICEFIYKQVVPVVIYISTVMVLLGMLAMYLAGELELTTKKEKKESK